MLLGNGDGTFQAATFTDLGVFPSLGGCCGITIDDLNNDGFLDVVVSGAANTVGSEPALEVLLGNGNGTFKLPIAGPVGAGEHLPTRHRPAGWRGRGSQARPWSASARSMVVPVLTVNKNLTTMTVVIRRGAAGSGYA